MFKQSRGSALLIALLIVVLASSVTILLVLQRHADVERTAEIIAYTQAKLEADRVTLWAKNYLKQSWLQQQTAHVPEVANIVFPAATIVGGTVSGQLEDQQAKFNLNNLRNMHDPLLIQKFLQTLAPDLDDEQSEKIALAFYEWIHVTKTNSDAIYLQRTIPYRASHQPLQSEGELLLIQGMTPALLQQLLPHIAELPPATPVNINTATAETLMMISPLMTLEQAQQIVEYRQQLGGFKTLEEALALPYFANQPEIGQHLTLSSDFFLVKADVNLHNTHYLFISLLQRNIVNKKPEVIVLWQQQGRHR